MQTLLAYALTGVSDVRVAVGLDRVERWYAPLWGTPTARSARAGHLGLVLWDRADEECRWRAWSECGGQSAASVQVPLGVERLVGGRDLATAPLALSSHLMAAPRDVLQLTAPFVLAHLDRDRGRLTMMTDGLGIGRLYELRTPEGRFWSNRPVAALRFAGVRAEADELAWRRMAACDWAMGERTAYRGVRAVGAATQVVADGDGHRSQAVDVLGQLTGSGQPLTDAVVEETAAALVDSARAVSRLWPEAPTLGLSGGRDSRLVVAAFVAAGVDISLKTYGGAAGEEDTARQLVARLPRPLPHRVTQPGAGTGVRSGPGAYARARQWHDLTEGLRPSVYLKATPPRQLLRQSPPLICGVGGEFGHAPGYPDDIERLERLARPRRLAAYGDSLQAKVVLPRGLAEHSITAVREQVTDVLEHAAARSVTDAKALDWFYADERLRRWGLAGESFGRVLPLLTPEFVLAAWGLSTAQSLDSALHSAVIARLVPSWAAVEFYSATLKQRQSVARRRLWEDDPAALSEVFADPAEWADAFDVGRVQAVWRSALAGRAAARDELLLQRVVWRAAFSDHLAAVNGQATGERLRVAVGAPTAGGTRDSAGVPAGTRPRRDLLGLFRTLAMRANDVPLARRLARSPVGRQLRRRLGV